MIENIDKWLSNPKRTYQEGVALFNAFATDSQKKDFKEFFEKDVEQVTDAFDIRFTMLVNQIAFIRKKIKLNPETFKKALVVAKVEVSPKTELYELPEALIPVRERIKEIVPLMAKLHADMANEVADDKRLVLIKKLVALDDERRACWAKIDNYEPDEVEKSVEASNVAMGAEIQKRVKQLRENISRNEISLKKHTANKKVAQAKKSADRIKQYKEELQELEKVLRE